MAAAAGTRVQVQDIRTAGQHLRASWYPDRRSVVFSHWRGNVCVASTPVPLEDLPAIVALLARALAEGVPVDRPRVAEAAGDVTDAPSWLGVGGDLLALTRRSVTAGLRSAARLVSWIR